MKIADISSPPAVSSVPSVPLADKLSGANWPFYRQLGRTDLTVSSLCLGDGNKISSADVLYAFEQGINYFFYSSDLHHYNYSHMSDALRQLCGRRSSGREQVVLATVTYIKNPDVVLTALSEQFDELGIDYVDLFCWGWVDTKDAPAFQDCANISNDLRGPNTVYQRFIEKAFGASERLKKMGAVRYVGAFFYDLNLARQWSHSSLLDVAMVRHNAAFRSAESEVLNQLDGRDGQRPGIVTFKSAGFGSAKLWEAPAGLPSGCWQPKLPDLYRYSLSQNYVDATLMFFQQREDIDAAIAGFQKGKLTPAELDYLSLYGDLHLKRLKVEEIPPERLLYCS